MVQRRRPSDVVDRPVAEKHLLLFSAPRGAADGGRLELIDNERTLKGKILDWLKTPVGRMLQQEADDYCRLHGFPTKVVAMSFTQLRAFAGWIDHAVVAGGVGYSAATDDMPIADDGPPDVDYFDPNTYYQGGAA